MGFFSKVVNSLSNAYHQDEFTKCFEALYEDREHFTPTTDNLEKSISNTVKKNKRQHAVYLVLAMAKGTSVSFASEMVKKYNLLDKQTQLWDELLDKDNDDLVAKCAKAVHEKIHGVDEETLAQIQTAYESIIKMIKGAKVRRDKTFSLDYLESSYGSTVQDAVVEKLVKKGYKIEGYDVIL